MFKFMNNKKGGNVCSVCGRTEEGNAQIPDLCNDCFSRCVYLSRQLEYLRNTSPENLLIIQKAVAAASNLQSSPMDKDKLFYDEIGDPPKDVSEKADPKSYYVVRKATGEKFKVEEKPFTIGSSTEKADVSIPENRTLSRVHAKVHLNNEGKCCVIDMNSKNGVKVRGQKIAPDSETVLNSGDVFSLASEVFKLVSE